MQKPARNTFPPFLPDWLREWAIDCTTVSKESVPSDDPRYYPACENEAFLRALRDPDVAADLHALDSPPGDAAAKERIKSFLSGACYFLSHSRTMYSATPSTEIKELRALAKAADKLAATISAKKKLLGPTTNIRYLAERATSENPRGFMPRRRAGLRAGRYITDRKLPGLVEILEAFSEDIKEELALFPKRISALDGSNDACIRFQIRQVVKAYQNLFGRMNFEAIARLLTCLNDACISPDRIRKLKS
ncbi:hypothetical protein RHDC1_01276 [Rhodocyclaceae bacterium]|nr:hypothetical protein RHDC1_01276 [Rhodocyclaceae bacterium]